jgi:hypothetical protein
LRNQDWDAFFSYKNKAAAGRAIQGACCRAGGSAFLLGFLRDVNPLTSGSAKAVDKLWENVI